MKKILLFLAIFLLSCSTNFKNSKRPRIEYPVWFLKPNNSIIGFSANHFYKKNIIKEATESALSRYAKLQFSIVKGKQVYIKNYEGISLVENSLHINIFENENFNKKFTNQFTIVDTFRKGDFVSLCWQKADSQLNPDTSKMYLKKHVNWLSKLPEDKNYKYAVGTCIRYGNEQNSWIEAENNAIISLAKQISVKNNIEELEAYGINMSKTIEYVDISLKNIEIVERWKSCDNDYFVLIRVAK